MLGDNFKMRMLPSLFMPEIYVLSTSDMKNLEVCNDIQSLMLIPSTPRTTGRVLI